MVLKRNISTSPLVFEQDAPAVWPGEIADITADIAAGLSPADWADVTADATQKPSKSTPDPEPVAPAAEDPAPVADATPETSAATADNTSEEGK